jgi:predicted NBD/HSP70 family sugar kinase
VQRNVPEAIHAIRNAGRILGEVIADSVSILNPSLIVVGGTLSRAGEHLLAGIRELVYQRSLPLATRELIIAAGRLDESAGIIGAAQLVFDTRFLPDVIDATIEGL